ncbi:hypothetical protein [Nitrosomonas sp. ANs5]|uniref:hypothetical protein n=1 Tax=Nitrosomonas sp. ANs5 TaxID=3423941 RepID=UPI003D32837D
MHILSLQVFAGIFSCWWLARLCALPGGIPIEPVLTSCLLANRRVFCRTAGGFDKLHAGISKIWRLSGLFFLPCPIVLPASRSLSAPCVVEHRLFWMI